jgi:enamine deaminase RidA (YjgF/YER057c/UK114 family)
MKEHPMRKILQPEGWARPVGYANGIATRGTQIHLAGLVGWTPECKFEAKDLAGQVRQTLINIVAVLKEAGAAPEHIVSMTWYVLDRKDYIAERREIGRHWREIIGRTFPAMAVVQVCALVEDEAKVEIQAVAVVPD